MSKTLPLDEDEFLDSDILFSSQFDSLEELGRALKEVLKDVDPKGDRALVSKPDLSEDSEPPSSSSPQEAAEEEFRKPKLRNRKFVFKPFLRLSSGKLVHNDEANPVDVVIPEQLAASYGLYIWPSSPVLSWYIWLHQTEFTGKTVLELGAGTSLPGLLCAKIGAEKVFLGDIATDENILNNCREAVKLNKLEDKVEVIGLSWGSYDPALLTFQNNLDYIIGSDLFFDPDVFDALCETLAFLLSRNPLAKIFITVQVRSEDWSIEEHLTKWKLKGQLIFPKEFLEGTDIEEGDLTGKHTIFILQVSKS